MSDGVASAREVGLDSGKITGRRLFSAMARTICSENEPGCPDTPIKVVGFALRTTSSNVTRPGCSTGHDATASRSCRNGRWNAVIPFMPSTSSPS